MQFSAAFIISLIPLVLALPAIVPRHEGIFGELLEPIEDIPVLGGLAEDVTEMIDHRFASEEKVIEPFAEPYIKTGEKAIGKEVHEIEDEIKHAIEHEVMKGFEYEFGKGVEHEVEGVKKGVEKGLEKEAGKGLEKEVGNGLEKEIGKGLEKEVEGGHSSGGWGFSSIFGGH